MPSPTAQPADLRKVSEHQSRQLNDDLLKQECWSCSNHTYTLVFWSHSIWQHVCSQNAELQSKFAPHYARSLLSNQEAKAAVYKPALYRPAPFSQGFVSQASPQSQMTSQTVERGMI